MSKPTCGPMYKEALDKYADGDESKSHAFAAGFVSGQAEKVYLGACRAAMFRPSQDRKAMLLEIVADAAARYGLRVVVPVGAKGEVWICRATYLPAVEMLRDCHPENENSEWWHRHRAFLCGVPDDEVDSKFHLRDRHGLDCDSLSREAQR